MSIVNTKMHYGNPDEKEKLRALEFLALTPTQKFDALMQLIAISYEVRQAKKNKK